eukprot:TRINITY_DN3056_c0_g1_i10.p1 TRINITY_DN3056_c0_g1~~TRINITY_DN3056_c0_g1_i10.p1  ORF type:complete len:612 (+),score=5.61 TRINITY_DN3056_c0_g1_i10:294-2129(+)
MQAATATPAKPQNAIPATAAPTTSTAGGGASILKGVKAPRYAGKETSPVRAFLNEFEAWAAQGGAAPSKTLLTMCLDGVARTAASTAAPDAEYGDVKELLIAVFAPAQDPATPYQRLKSTRQDEDEETGEFFVRFSQVVRDIRDAGLQVTDEAMEFAGKLRPELHPVAVMEARGSNVLATMRVAKAREAELKANQGSTGKAKTVAVVTRERVEPERERNAGGSYYGRDRDRERDERFAESYRDRDREYRQERERGNERERGREYYGRDSERGPPRTTGREVQQRPRPACWWCGSTGHLRLHCEDWIKAGRPSTAQSVAAAADKKPASEHVTTQYTGRAEKALWGQGMQEGQSERRDEGQSERHDEGQSERRAAAKVERSVQGVMVGAMRARTEEVRLIVKARVGDWVGDALLDSGADVSGARRTVLEAAGCEIRPYTGPSLCAADGRRIAVEGEADVEVEVLQEAVKMRIICMATSGAGVILGKDALSRCGVELDFARSEIRVGKRTVEMRGHVEEKRGMATIRLEEGDVELQAGKEYQLIARVGRGKEWAGKDVLVQGRPGRGRWLEAAAVYTVDEEGRVAQIERGGGIYAKWEGKDTGRQKGRRPWTSG